MSERLCKTCGDPKPISEFKNGARCRECRNAASRAHHWANREARVLAMREWHDKNREHHREISKRNYYRRVALGTFPKADPVKKRARAMVQNAVRYGKIVKPTDCPDCGTPTPSHKMHGHHHNGYNNPLDVKWTCSLCHGRAHRRVQVSHSAQTGATA